MITRDQLKAEIDAVDTNNIEILHRIIQVLQAKTRNFDYVNQHALNNQSPLKDSVTFETDIISPINVNWDADS